MPLATCSAPQNSGSCQLTGCTFGEAPDTVPTAGLGDFGPISASVGGATEELVYERDRYLRPDFDPTVELETGVKVTFHGEGGSGVPMFDVSAIIPGAGIITAPAPAIEGSSYPIIDTSEDLSVTWLPISIGQISFRLLGGPLAGNTPVILSCEFDGAAGAGVVPRKLLSLMKEQNRDRVTFGDLSAELETTTKLDGLTIRTGSYHNSADEIRDFQVTLQ